MKKDDDNLYNRLSSQAKSNLDVQQEQSKIGPKKDYWFIYNVIFVVIGIIALIILAGCVATKQYKYVGTIGIVLFFVLGMFYSEAKMKHHNKQNNGNGGKSSTRHFNNPIKNFSDQLNHRH